MVMTIPEKAYFIADVAFGTDPAPEAHVSSPFNLGDSHLISSHP
jgi:hypothetical protein